MDKKLPLWTTKDFKIKQTACGYSVYYVHDEKSRCLISRLHTLKQATNYIDWLINFTKELHGVKSETVEDVIEGEVINERD